MHSINLRVQAFGFLYRYLQCCLCCGLTNNVSVMSTDHHSHHPSCYSWFSVITFFDIFSCFWRVIYYYYYDMYKAQCIKIKYGERKKKENLNYLICLIDGSETQLILLMMIKINIFFSMFTAHIYKKRPLTWNYFQSWVCREQRLQCKHSACTHSTTLQAMMK